MEHRNTRRCHVALPVTVRRSGRLLCHAHTVNASAGGLLIDTGRSHLAPGSLVELTLSCDDGSRRSAWGLVVHAQAGRAGLMLDEDALELRTLLRDAVRTAMPAVA